MPLIRHLLGRLRDVRSVGAFLWHRALRLELMRLVLVLGDLILAALVKIDKGFGQVSDFLLGEEEARTGVAADAMLEICLAVHVKYFLVMEILDGTE